MLKNLNLLDDWTFVRGEGNPKDKTACAMSAFSILNGEAFSDSSPCVSKVWRDFIIHFNDRIPFDDLRERFAMNVVCHIAETANDGQDEQRRFRIVEFALGSCAKRAFEVVGWHGLAEKVNVAITDQESLRAARSIAYDCMVEARNGRDAPSPSPSPSAYVFAAAAAYAADAAVAAAAAADAAATYDDASDSDDAYDAAVAAAAAADASYAVVARANYAAVARAAAAADTDTAAVYAAVARAVYAADTDTDYAAVYEKRKTWELLTTDAIALIRSTSSVTCIAKELATE